MVVRFLPANPPRLQGRGQGRESVCALPNARRSGLQPAGVAGGGRMRRGRVYSDTEPGKPFGKVSCEDIDAATAADYWGPNDARSVVP
jgi:hypothetical protein